MKVTTLSHDYSSVFTGFLSYLSAGQLSNTVFLLDDRTHCAHGIRHTKCTNCKHSTLGTVSIYYSIQTVHNVYIERNVPFLNTVNIVHNVQGVHTLQIKNTVQWYCPLLDLLIWASGLIVGAKVALYLWTPSLSLYCTTCCITILVPLFSSLVSPVTNFWVGVKKILLQDPFFDPPIGNQGNKGDQGGTRAPGLNTKGNNINNIIL